MAKYTPEGTFLPDYNKGDENKLDIDLLRRKFTARVNNLYTPQLEGGIQIDKRLNIDPRVLYRWVGLDAIKDFDSSGLIRGPEIAGFADEAVLGQQPPFFSQGMPLWQYAGGVSAGTGTAKSASNPYLIGTVGADWTSRTGTRTVDDSQVVRSNFEDYIEQERGLTRGAKDAVVDTRMELKKLAKFVDELTETKSTSPKHIEGLMKRYQTILEGIKPHERTLNKYLHGTEGLEQVYDDEVHLDSLSKSIGANLGVTNLDFTPETEWLGARGGERQLNEFANMLIQRRDELSRLTDDLQPSPNTFNLTPRQYRTFNGRDATSFALPRWLKSMENSTDLRPSDSALFERIKNGTATPEELNALYGMGRFDYDLNDMGNPLRHLDLRRSGSGAMYHERLPNTRIQPSNANWSEGWEVPSAYLDVKDRPFAVWQYTKNGLRLVNQGNNNPVLGNRPIPTELQDPYLTYMDLSESKARMAPDLATQTGKIRIEKFAQPDSVFSLSNVIDESTKGSRAYGRKGFADMNLLTKPLQRHAQSFANVAKGVMEKDEFLAMMQKGLSNPDHARNFATNYARNPATRAMVNAEMGASAIKFLGKVGAVAGIATAPSSAVERRDRIFSDWATNNRGYPHPVEDFGMRVQAGMENALAVGTFGISDEYLHPEWREPMEPVQRGYYSDNGQRVPNWVPNLQSTLLSPR